MDPTRLVNHVSEGRHWYDEELAKKLFICDDVICINAYATKKGLTECGFENYDVNTTKTFWEKHGNYLKAAYKNKPIFVTEFGMYLIPNSDELTQAWAIETDYKCMKPYVNGCLVWHFADHVWPVRYDGEIPYLGTEISYYGVVDRNRNRRLAYAKISELFHDNEPTYFAGNIK